MYKNSDTCLEKTDESEPIFVLVARDRLAIPTIRKWIEFAEQRGVGPKKRAEALSVLLAMMEWQKENPSFIPD